MTIKNLIVLVFHINYIYTFTRKIMEPKLSVSVLHNGQLWLYYLHRSAWSHVAFNLLSNFFFKLNFKMTDLKSFVFECFFAQSFSKMIWKTEVLYRRVCMYVYTIKCLCCLQTRPSIFSLFCFKITKRNRIKLPRGFLVS